MPQKGQEKTRDLVPESSGSGQTCVMSLQPVGWGLRPLKETQSHCHQPEGEKHLQTRSMSKNFLSPEIMADAPH